MNDARRVSDARADFEAATREAVEQDDPPLDYRDRIMGALLVPQVFAHAMLRATRASEIPDEIRDLICDMGPHDRIVLGPDGLRIERLP